jgi:dCMP deaminase
MVIIGSFAVIHRGYLEILDKYQDADIFILSDELAQELYKLEIDLRKMPINKTADLLTSLNRNVNILNKDNIDEVKKAEKIILIEDDTTTELKNKYLAYHPNIIIENGFFYHPHENVFSSQEKNIDLIKNYTEEDTQYMKQAIVLASESGCFWRQVASIIVKDNKVLYQSFNKMLPNNDECYKIGCIRDNIEPGVKTENCSAVHSEASVIAQAAKNGVSLKDASIYVTVFPCPACAKLIAISGLKKCYYNTGWSNFDGQRVMEAAGIEIIKIDL